MHEIPGHRFEFLAGPFLRYREITEVYIVIGLFNIYFINHSDG